MSEPNEICECVRALLGSNAYAFDLETTGLDKFNDVIIGAAFTVKQKKVYKSWYFKPDPGCSMDDFFKPFESVFLDHNKLAIFHNAKFDLSMLRVAGIKFFNKISDTMILAWIIDENRTGSGRLKLKGKGSLTHELFGVELATYAQSSLSGSLFGKDEATYACHDTEYTYKCHEALLPELKKQGLEKLYWELEMEIIPIVMDMELRGMYLDVHTLWKLDKELVAKHDEIQAEFYAKAGRRMNIGSTEQLSAFFFDELKWEPQPGMERGKNGLYPTDESVLSKYAVEGKELAQLVLDYRGTLKMLQTYVRPFVKLATSNSNSRIYGSLHQTGTVTGRFCVSKDTKVDTLKGVVPICKIKKGDLVLTHTMKYQEVLNVIYKGEERMWNVYTNSGKTIRCTMNHMFLTPEGWKSLRDIRFGGTISVFGGLEHGVVEDAISWFGPSDVEGVWDIEVNEDHSYVGNGIVNHNSSSDPNLQNCFDPLTEILTDSGWCFIKDVNEKTKVAQFDKVTNEVSFVEPIGLVSVPFSGELVTISNYSTDLRMTPEHNCLVCHNDDNVFSDIPASEYPIGAYQLNAAVLDRKSEVLTGMSENFLMLVVATQARGIRQGDIISYKTYSEKDLEGITKLLDANLVPYIVSLITETPVVKVDAKDPLVSRLIAFLGESNEFPWWFVTLPKNLREAFCTVVLRWFGGCSGWKTKYASKSPSNCGLVQALFSLSGMSSTVSHDVESGLYYVTVSNSTRSKVSEEDIGTVPHTGMVHCVTVPSGYVVVRRNGKVSITGNCPRKKGTIKQAFKSPPGKTLLVCDYSQLELRIIAHMSQDPTMLEVYRNGGDIHKTTQEALGCSERAPAKGANFGFIYGMSARTFQANLWRQARVALPLQECFSFEAAFFKKYSGIKEYHESVENFLRKHRYVKTLTGRRRHLTDELKANYGSALRQAINFTVQGLGSDIIKIAMRNFQRALVAKRVEDPRWEEVFMVMQVHDELVLEAPLCLSEDVRDLLKYHMENAVKLSIPLIAEPAIAGQDGSWEDCK